MFCHADGELYWSASLPEGCTISDWFHYSFAFLVLLPLVVQFSPLILILIFCSLVLDGLDALGSMVYHTVSIDIHLRHLYTWIICLRIYGVVWFDKIWPLLDWDWDGFMGLELFWVGSVIFELGLREGCFCCCWTTVDLVGLDWFFFFGGLCNHSGFLLVWIGLGLMTSWILIQSFNRIYLLSAY